MGRDVVWWAFFYLISAFVLFNAIIVVTSPTLFRCLLHLMLVFVGVAGLFLLQGAIFLAGVQVLIYTGGVTTLILFAVMLSEEVVGKGRALVSRGKGMGIVVAACFLVLMFALYSSCVVFLPPTYEAHISPVAQFVAKAPSSAMGNVEAFGVALLTQFLVPFEFVSVLILVAIVGAITVARLSGSK